MNIGMFGETASISQQKEYSLFTINWYLTEDDLDTDTLYNQVMSFFKQAIDKQHYLMSY